MQFHRNRSMEFENTDSYLSEEINQTTKGEIAMTENKVKGYKVFNSDWICKGFKYEVGETYKHEGKIELCGAGFHFCEQLKDCFNYYSFNPENKVAEVLASGQIISGNNKSVTNTLKIVKEITWNDVLNLVNTGLCNAGDGNTGNCNTGDWNSGDWNTGNWNPGNRNAGNGNTGDWNSGDWNTGNWNSGNGNTGNRNAGNGNTGDLNSGDWNTGNWNSGNRNLGDWNTGTQNAGYCNTGNSNTGDSNTGNMNSGDRNPGNRESGHCNTGYWNAGCWNTGMFNSCDYSNGLFNSKPPKIYMFNKPTNLTYEELKEKYSEAYNLLYCSSFILTEWISDYEMTDEEKEAHPEYKTAGGYLKNYSYKEACQKMWDSFDKQQRNKIKQLPNFNKEIFKDITGIEVEND